MIQGTKSPGKIDRFAACQQQRSLNIYHCTGNDRARANPDPNIPLVRSFFLTLATLAKILQHFQDNAGCFLSMVSVWNWKSKERNDPFPVRGMQISVLGNEMRCRLAN